MQWSFGVTCWACGGVPYAAVPATTLLSDTDWTDPATPPALTTCKILLVYTCAPMLLRVYTSLFVFLSHSASACYVSKNTANDCSCALVIRGSTNLATWFILCECHGHRWAVIASCWSASAQERPNFATLVKTLTELLDSDPTYIKLSSNSLECL